MDTAKCTMDGMSYKARVFSDQDDFWKLARRGTLECPECGSTAHFRKKTRDGKAACFYAQHAEGCEFAGHDVETQEGHGIEDVVEMSNEGQVLELRLDGPAPAQAADYRRHAGDDASGGEQIRRYGQGGDGPQQRRNVRSIGLRRLLNHLIQDDQYAQSDERISIPARGAVPLKDFVREFREVSDADLDRTMAVWGKVISVGGASDGLMYLNSGFMGNNPCFVVLRKDIHETVREALDWEYLSSVVNGYVVVVGKVVSAQGDRYKISPESINNIALREPLQ